MKIAALAMLALYGCGGSSFTAGDSLKDGGGDAIRDADARSEASVDSGSVDAAILDADSAGPAPGEGGADSGAPDVSTPDTAPAGDGNTCVPIPPSTVIMGMLCGGQATQAMYQVPAQFIFSEQGCLVPEPTPAACQCAGSYTCACINFNPGTAVSCSMQGGMVVFSGN